MDIGGVRKNAPKECRLPGLAGSHNRERREFPRGIDQNPAEFSLNHDENVLL
jgi:hypothetical protein